MGSNKQIPKRAFTKPRISDVIFFVVFLIFLTTNSAPVGFQFFIFVFSLPLIIPGFFCSYYSGLSLAKLNYDRIKSGKVLSMFLWLAIFQLSAIGICFLIEIWLTGGYPIHSCIDFCSVVKTEQIFISYFVVSTVILAPVYYAAYRYSVWVRKYNIKSVIRKK